VNAVDGSETSASGEPATEITIPQNESSLNTVLTEKLDEEIELKNTLGAFDKDSVLVVDADGRAIQLVNNFENGGIGLPENGTRVVYAPAVTQVREQPPVTTHSSA
jgi:hypothetical protein